MVSGAAFVVVDLSDDRGPMLPAYPYSHLVIVCGRWAQTGIEYKVVVDVPAG